MEIQELENRKLAEEEGIDTIDLDNLSECMSRDDILYSSELIIDNAQPQDPHQINNHDITNETLNIDTNLNIDNNIDQNNISINNNINNNENNNQDENVNNNY